MILFAINENLRKEQRFISYPKFISVTENFRNAQAECMSDNFVWKIAKSEFNLESWEISYIYIYILLYDFLL